MGLILFVLLLAIILGAVGFWQAINILWIIALVPLVLFTARRDVMGVLVNHRATTAVASVVAALICALNVFLLAQTAGL